MSICVEPDMRLAGEPILRREVPVAQRDSPRKTRKWLLMIVVLAIVVLIAVVLDEILRPQKFPLQNIQISGPLQNVSRVDIEAAISAQIQGNYFSLKLDRIEKAIKALPWVESAKVRRRWPRNLHIDVREQRPVAQWGSQNWMNSSGDVFAVDYRDITGRLPMFNGAPGSNKKILEHYRRWANVLAGTGLQIKAISLSARYEWSVTVYLNRSRVSATVPSIVGGQSLGAQKRRGSIGDPGENINSERLVTLVLGRDQVDLRLARFAKVFKKSLIAKAASISRADLRYPNGFAIQWVEPTVNHELKADGSPVENIKNQKIHYSKLSGLEIKAAMGR